MSEEIQTPLPATLAGFSDKEIVEKLLGLPPETEIALSPLAEYIVYTENGGNPRRWATISESVLTLLSEKIKLPPEEYYERTVTFALEQVNGLRRTPDWNPTALDALLGMVKSDLSNIPPGERRTRLKGLYCYHGAMMYHASGDYGKAAECHEAASTLPGKRFDVELAKYMAVYERLNEALVHWDSNLISIRMDALEQAGAQFRNAFNHPPTPLEVQWNANVKIHLWRADFLSMRGTFEHFPNQPLIHEIAEELPKNLFPAFADALAVLTAVERAQMYKPKLAYLLAFQVGKNPLADPDWRSEALLLCGLLEQHEDCDRAEARKIYQSVIDLKGHGGHVARAIAKRILATIESHPEGSL